MTMIRNMASMTENEKSNVGHPCSYSDTGLATFHGMGEVALNGYRG